MTYRDRRFVPETGYFVGPFTSREVVEITRRFEAGETHVAIAANLKRRQGAVMTFLVRAGLMATQDGHDTELPTGNDAVIRLSGFAPDCRRLAGYIARFGEHRCAVEPFSGVPIDRSQWGVPGAATVGATGGAA